MVRPIPPQTLELWKRREESNVVKLVAYWDGYAHWTIGYGHTGPEVVKGLRISLPQADAYLYADLSEAALAVEHLVRVPINDNQFAALIDFTGNAGSGNLAKSTLLRRLNARDYDGAALEFLKWTYAADRTGKLVYSSGLKDRRVEEMNLFKRPSGTTGPTTQPVPLPTPAPEPPAPTPQVDLPPMVDYAPAPDVGTEPPPLSQSTTIWSAVSAFIASGGAMVLSYVQSPYALVALAMVLVFAYFIIRERAKHRNVSGV